MTSSVLEPILKIVEARLFDIPGGPTAFNPFHDLDAELDLADAVERRRANFGAYVRAYDAYPEVLLVAEAPGPWGCRFSGVPVTSEAQLVDPDFPINGVQSSRRNQPYTEYSASIYWRALKPHFPRFFTWNTFPFHPFKKDSRLSIRTPTRQEVLEYTDLLGSVVRLSRAKQVLAVGRKAEMALRTIGFEPMYVRHPSQGGAILFTQTVLSLMQENG
jgi:hypothetical protein